MGRVEPGWRRGPTRDPAPTPHRSQEPGTLARGSGPPPTPNRLSPGALPGVGPTCPLASAGLRLEVGGPGGNLQAVLTAR